MKCNCEKGSEEEDMLEKYKEQASESNSKDLLNPIESMGKTSSWEVVLMEESGRKLFNAAVSSGLSNKLISA